MKHRVSIPDAVSAMAVLAINFIVSQPVAAQTFQTNAPMISARGYHTSTPLNDGKVLVAGGADSNTHQIAATESFDPESRTWSTNADLNIRRSAHTATLLTNGQVLVAGGSYRGSGLPSGPLTSAEIFDPATRTWTVTNEMKFARYYHTATLLPNGRVLVAGGAFASYTAIPSAELFDPATGTWTLTGPMAIARQSHTATLLPNGKVLVAGGTGDHGGQPINSGQLSSAEIYDPASGIWSSTGAMVTNRAGHSATLLASGQVLVAGGGGFVSQYSWYVLSSAELYDPVSGRWSATGEMSLQRSSHTATLLSHGLVLVTAGSQHYASSAGAELFDPFTGQWTPTGSMSMARVVHTATLLPNGEVLVAGGYHNSDDYLYLSSTERYCLPPQMPRLKSQIVSGYPTVSVAGMVGTNYCVQYRNSLTDSNWTQLSSFTMTTNPAVVVDTNAVVTESQARFYRAYAN